MRRFVKFLLPSLLVLAAAAPAADPKPADKKAPPDPKQFEGTWEVLSETWCGWQLPDDLRVQEIIFKGNRYTEVSKVKTLEYTWRFPKAKPPAPKVIEEEAVKKADPPAAEEIPGFDIVDTDQEMGYFQAIYKFDKDNKDRLTVCYIIKRSQDRPTEFNAGADTPNCMMILKRKKAS